MVFCLFFPTRASVGDLKFDLHKSIFRIFLLSEHSVFSPSFASLDVIQRIKPIHPNPLNYFQHDDDDDDEAVTIYVTKKNFSAGKVLFALKTPPLINPPLALLSSFLKILSTVTSLNAVEWPKLPKLHDHF